MKSWFFPTNIKKFRIHDFLSEHEIMDFKQSSSHVQVGDIVYLYCTLPEARVTYKLIVEKINLSSNEIIDDDEYVLTPTLTTEYQKNEIFCRLRLLKHIDTDALSLENMRLRGLKSCIQNQQIVKESLLPYVERCFDD